MAPLYYVLTPSELMLGGPFALSLVNSVDLHRGTNDLPFIRSHLGLSHHKEGVR